MPEFEVKGILNNKSYETLDEALQATKNPKNITVKLDVNQYEAYVNRIKALENKVNEVSKKYETELNKKNDEIKRLEHRCSGLGEAIDRWKEKADKKDGKEYKYPFRRINKSISYKLRNKDRTWKREIFCTDIPNTTDEKKLQALLEMFVEKVRQYEKNENIYLSEAYTKEGQNVWNAILEYQ